MTLQPHDFPQSRHWIDLTTIDAADLPPETVAILPVAAAEQHGPHLPLGTDAFINRGLIGRMSEILPRDVPLLILPEQTVGASDEHLDFPGTLSHRPARLIDIYTDVLACVRTTSVRRLILFNSHGGQMGLLSPVALDLRVRFGLFVAYASWFDGPQPDGLMPEEDIHYDMHGGLIETSLMLHLRPDLVRFDLAQDFRSRVPELDAATRQISANPGHGRLAGFGWKSQDLHKSGVMGNAAGATAEAGRTLLDFHARRLAELVQDMVTATALIES